MRPDPSPALLIASALAASLLLSGVVLAMALAALLILLERIGSKGRASLWLGLGAAIVLVILGVEAFSGTRASSGLSERQEIASNWEDLWQRLDRVAESTATRLEGLADPAEKRLAVFDVLDDQARRAALPVTLHMIDRRGTAFAWGGPGLLHGIEELAEAGPGRRHAASFSAVTLASVRRISAAGETWDVATGLSLRTETFPFARLSGEVPGWSVFPAGAEVGDDVLVFTADSGPDLVVDKAALERSTPTVFPWRSLAMVIWGAFLLLQAWLWVRDRRRLAGPVAAAVAGYLIGVAGGGSPLIAGCLAVGGGLGSWAYLRGGIRADSAILAAPLGVVAGLSGWGVANLLDTVGEAADLGGRLWSGPEAWTTRLAVAILAWGLLALIRPGGRASTGSAGTAALAVTLLAAFGAAAGMDRPAVALALLALSGAAAGIWQAHRQSTSSLVLWAWPAMVATLLAATGWEVAYRTAERQRVRIELLAAMAPPTAGEIETLADQMESFLGSWDLSALMPGRVPGASQQDLAFEIWRRSPLTRFGGLSALRVLPRAGEVSSFSFGLPLNEEGWVDWSSPLLGTVEVPAWQDAVLVGDGVLARGGESWAYAEYALAPLPGFRLRGQYPGDLAEVLLRSGPKTGALFAEELGDVVYGLFTPAGQPVVSAWSRPPSLTETLLAGGEDRVTTPDGRAIAVSEQGSDGLRVLFLPAVTWSRAMDRLGTHVLPTVMALGLLILVLRIPRWLRTGLGAAWFHLWHSYSRRLVLVYSVLLLLPLGIINFLVVRAFEERLVREQEAAGLLAVESAQGVLGEYVRALEPGFGIDAALDDELLYWLSGVIHHDVNLYWRGRVYASSKAELFTAGLLPRRIPGEIYSGLTLRGHSVSMRTNQAGRSDYLELYAPLRVPGVSFERTRLIVSLPLLAQQQETAAKIATLRRRSLLGTVAVVLVIMALGARLARRFTAPITEIVAGTQRIAAGEPSLNLEPAELELATLVDAIDDMAARIHAGRQELLREKRVVDRMVENITSGVVSLDESGRVLMVNRVAEQMVGAEVGRDLTQIVAREPRLSPLAEFLRGASGGGLSQKTVNLRDAEGHEQEWSLVWVPLPGVGEPSALLVLEDVTEVLQGQRLQAWAEMARMIAHEIKNPLTPIRLSAEHMQEVYAADPEGFAGVFESCTANILSQVSELQEIASEFSTYSRIPKIEPRRGDLVAVAETIVEAYRPTRGVAVELHAPAARVEAVFDAKLLGRAVRNLVENALRVTPERGRIEVAVESRDGGAVITVSDDGPGVDERLLSRIFDPYFSTHDAGTGLGLPIAKRIAEEHGGEIEARNRDSGGLEVTIRLPVP